MVKGIPQPKPTDMKETARKHWHIRMGVILVVAVAVILSTQVRLMNPKESDEGKQVPFYYAGASVEWVNDSVVQINIWNNSTIYTIRVIGKNAEGIEVEAEKNVTLGVDNITFNIEKLMLDNMTIWVEVENGTEGIKERQIWWQGD